MTVKINLYLILYLLRDVLSIKSTDRVSSLYNSITLFLSNFNFRGVITCLASSCC